MMKNKVTVAVIDTGLTVNYLASDINIQKYVSMKQRTCDGSDIGEVEVTEGSWLENREIPSHGTRVVNTIKKYALDTPIEFNIYNVFDDSGKSSGAVVLEAIKMILEDDIDVIVMSITCSPKYKKDFERFVSIIQQKKVLFICAASNTGQCHCPADLEFVYGVSGEAIVKSGLYRYEPSAKFQFWSDIQWEFIGDLEQLQVFCGTSKATAVIAGRLIRYMYKHGKDELFQYLAVSHDELAEMGQIDTESIPIERELLKIYCQVFDLEEESCLNNLDTLIPWHQDNIYNFVIFMQRIGLEKNIGQLNYSEFATVRNILHACSIRKNPFLVR